MPDNLVPVLLKQPADRPRQFRAILIDFKSREFYAPICHLSHDDQVRLLTDHQEQIVSRGCIHFARLEWLVLNWPEASDAWMAISDQLNPVIKKQFLAQ